MSLHRTVENTKTLAKVATITIAGIILLIFVLRILIGVKDLLFPKQAPPPVEGFGKLPPILFPKSALTTKLVYPIDTVTGTLPTFPDRIEVYKTIQPQPSLLFLNRARDKVSKLGFSSGGKQIAPTVYQWENPNPPYKKIVLDILSFNFEMTSDFLSDKNVLDSRNVPGGNGAIDLSKSFLSGISSFPSDIDDSKTKMTQLSIKDNKLTPATSFSTTQIIQVDFYQKNIKDYQVYYPNYPGSSMSILVGGGQFQGGQVVGAHFFHQQIGEESTTYPLKSSQEAYQELQEGKAFIVSFNGSGKAAYINNMHLGYYISETKQDYLMPIYIFEGRNSFYAFLSAIRNESLK